MTESVEVHLELLNFGLFRFFHLSLNIINYIMFEDSYLQAIILVLGISWSISWAFPFLSGLVTPWPVSPE